MDWLRVVALLAALGSARGLYEDQVGDFDWQQQYLGHVSWVSYEQVPGGRRKVILGSERGVIGAVTASTGTIAWRHSLDQESGGIWAIIHHKSVLVTLSGQEHLLLRAWECDNGLLRWETPTGLSTASSASDYPLDQVWRPGGVSAIVAGAKKELVLAAYDGVLLAFSMRSGKQLWKTSLPKGVLAAAYSNGTVAIVLTTSDDGHVTVAHLDTANKGTVVDSHTWDQTFDTESLSCSLMLDFARVVCVENGRLYLGNIMGPLHPLSLEKDFSITASSPSINPTSSSTVLVGHQLLRLDQSAMKAELLCESCVEGERETAGTRVRVRATSKDGQLELQQWQGESGREKLIPLEETSYRGLPVLVGVLVAVKQDGASVTRVLLRFQDSSLMFISLSGEVIWMREEALEGIVAAEMVDLPSSQATSESVLSLLQVEGNPFVQFLQRINLQAVLLRDWVEKLAEKGTASFFQVTDSGDYLRDEFNMKKMIVAATTSGKLFGLDSDTGEIAWWRFLPDIRPLSDGSLRLYLLRTSSHPPHPPMAAVLGRVSPVDQNCTESLLYTFNPITGELTNPDSAHLPYCVVQTTLLPLFDSTHQRVLVLQDDAGLVHCLGAERCDGLTTPNSLPVFIYSVDQNRGVMEGREIVREEMVDEALQSQVVWRITFPSRSEKIIAFASRSHEAVPSLGRVRGDRSVQYKYLNPNLVAVVTESTEKSKPSLMVYLADVVSGAVVYQATHRHTCGPVNIVLSENWVVYTYFNVKSRRVEVAVMEMYDTRNQTEFGWSSVAPPIVPLVTTQSYIFPTSIPTLSLSSTLRSLTHKTLLFGLVSGHIAAIKKTILDPRRTLHPSQELMEEGIPAYIPELPLSPRVFINYNQTVTGLRGILSAPTGLESTSLVFAYGQDLFFTRITPSKQFDMLAEDFDYMLIAAVVLGLVVATVVLSFLSSRKLLKFMWK